MDRIHVINMCNVSERKSLQLICPQRVILISLTGHLRQLKLSGVSQQTQIVYLQIKHSKALSHVKSHGMAVRGLLLLVVPFDMA